jgi:hypothetical protein
MDLGGGKKENRKYFGMMGFQITDKGAKELWRSAADISTMHSSPVIYREYVYVELTAAAGSQDGRIGCFELATGKPVQIHDKMGRTASDASPVAGDGRVIFRSQGSGGGGFMGLSEGAKGFNKLGGPTPPVAWEPTISPAYANGRLYFRGANSLWCYDLRKAK